MLRSEMDEFPKRVLATDLDNRGYVIKILPIDIRE